MPRPPLPLALALLAACGGSTSDTTPAGAGGPTDAGRAVAAAPEDVALAFFEAARAEDRDALSALLTERAQASLDQGGALELDAETLGPVEVGAATVERAEARVPTLAVVDGLEQDLGLLLRREAGAWRVYGFDASFGGEGRLTIDLEAVDELLTGMVEGIATEMAGAFEEAFTEWSQGGSPEEIAAARAGFEALAALTPAEHRAAWQVDVRATERAAREVLATLVEGTGVVLDTDGHAALEQPITVELSGVSRLEALEHVAASLGLHPRYPDASPWAFGVPDGEPEPPTIAFAAGPRALPATSAGPFLVEVIEVVETPPTATGSLRLAVRALGLAPACLAFQTEMVELCALDAIEDADGDSLNADEDVSFLGTPQVEAGYLSDVTQVDLKGLLRDVEAIATVRGRIALSLPVELTEARCSAQGGGVEAGPYAVEPKDWGTYTTFQVTGAPQADGPDGELVVRLSPLDTDGAPLGALTSDSMGWDGTVHASVQTAEPPAHVELKLCRVATLSYPFELTDVPLARHAEMPAALDALEFDGAAPVDVAFVRFAKRDPDFPEVELDVRSRCNKDAAQIVVTFHYVDASGTELDSFQHTLTGTHTLEGVEPFAARSTETHTTTAFFMPPETDRLQVTVTGVEFVDASTWTQAD